MYNRYLASAADDAPPIHAEPADTSAVSALAGLSRTLNDRFQNLRLDMDTVIALVIVWFLLSDGTENSVDWDQFLLVGALLILGV